jgi:hypothetical protein
MLGAGAGRSLALFHWVVIDARRLVSRISVTSELSTWYSIPAYLG